MVPFIIPLNVPKTDRNIHARLNMYQSTGMNRPKTHQNDEKENGICVRHSNKIQKTMCCCTDYGRFLKTFLHIPFGELVI